MSDNNVIRVEESGTYSEIEPGVHYGTFKGIEKSDSKDGKPFFKWMFSGEDGKEYVGFSDCDNAKTGNKLGRLVLGLKGAKSADSINWTEYVGKKYALVYKVGKTGKCGLDTISPCNN